MISLLVVCPTSILASDKGTGNERPEGTIGSIDLSDIGGPVVNSGGGNSLMGVHALQVRNPNPIPRTNEVVRFTLNLPDGELIDSTNFRVNDVGAGHEVLSGSLASTVVRYASNFVKKMDVVFQDDFAAGETKSYEIVTGQSPGVSSDLSYTSLSTYIYVYDGTRQYQIQTSNDLNHFNDGVFVNYQNGSFSSSSRLMVRVSGNQLMLDQGIISLAWGNPMILSLDSNMVMVSVHMRYERPFMVGWGPSWSPMSEIVKDVDFLYADLTINIYNDKALVESVIEKKFKEKYYNHNGVVMEFAAMYNGDGDYLAIMGNSQHTVKEISSRILTWESVSTSYAGIDEGNYSVPSFADLNGDGMKDMIIGNENGTLSAFHNTGTPGAPVWTYDGTIYSGIDVGNRSAPAVYDLDEDGDNDTVVGNETGHLQYYNNTGDPITPLWTYEPSMFVGVTVNNCSKPEFADLDDDGDLDMIIGMGNGNISYYENTGDSSVPVWTYDMTHFRHLNDGATRIPTSFVSTPTRFSSPAFADVDSDGDLDFSSGFGWSYYNLLSHFENTGNATDPVFTMLRPDLFATVRGSGFDKLHSVPRFVDMNGDSLLDIIAGGVDGKLAYFENRGLMGRTNMPIYNMQPLENGTYRFYIDQDSNDGPYSIVNYSADFNDYYVLAKPSSGKAILRYVPGFAEQVYRDRYNGDRYLWAGGNVSYYPFIPEEDGYITRGILIARGFSGSGTSKGISGGTFLSQTGTAGGFQQVAMTSMSHESRMVLLTELAYNPDHSAYDDLVDLLKTPLEIIVLPDLFFDEKGITFTPGVAGEGELVIINATVHNIGGQVANGVDVDFYHGTLSPSDKFATSTITSIDPGGKGYAEAAWDSTGNAGSNLFYVVVDPADLIAELDETNNNASRNLEVTSWRLGREVFQVTSDTNTSMDPTAAVDSSGRVWVAYHTYTHNDDFEVFARNYDGSWSPEELIGADAKRTSRPFIVSRGSDVWLTYTSNSVEVDMYNSTRQGWYYWAMKFDLYAHRFDGVAWQPGARLTQSVILNESDQIPSAVIDDSGRLWLGYRHTNFGIYAVPGEQIANQPYKDMNITGAMYDGSWTVPFNISAEPWSEGWFGGPTMALDESGRVWAIYEWENLNTQWDIYGRFWNGTTWSAPQQITSDNNMDIRPSTIRDADGNLWVVWESNRAGNKDIYAKFYDGTSWSQDTRLTFDPGHDIKPSVTADIFGNVWVVWENDRDGNKNIYLKRYDGAAWLPDIPLTSDEKSDECPFIVSDDTTGDLWVVWETDRNGHGNKDVYAMRLFIDDSSSPITTITIGEPKHIAANTYITSASPISLSADDNQGVGVASTWFRTWNSTDGWTDWQEYVSDFTLAGADGFYYIEYNSTDLLGNLESPNNTTVYLDNSYPITSMNPGTPIFISGGVIYFGSSTQFTLTANDGMGSGANNTWYRIWESSMGWSSRVRYTVPFTISGPDGPRYIECSSDDYISNTEPAKNCTSSQLYLDSSRPSTDLMIGNPQYTSGGGTYVTSGTPFTLTPSDGAGSGVDSTWYRIWTASSGWSLWNLYSVPFTISGPDGTCYIEYNSTDMIGNPEPTNNQTVILDNTEPQTSISIGQPSHIAAYTYITSGTEITLNPSDSGSGVNSTWYRIWNSADGWSQWIEYAGQFTIAGPDGMRYIEYNATDNLGNREAPNNHSSISDIYLDNRPPVTSISIGSPNYTSGQYIFVNSSTRFDISVDEQFATIWYMIDTSGPFVYASGFTIAQDGTHTIYYNATDALGNAESPKNNITVIVDNAPPSTTHAIGSPKYGTDPVYVTSATQFTLNANDGSGSGVLVTYYRIGAGTYTQYTGPFTLSGSSGTYAIYYYSVDNVGNPEVLKTLSIFLDESPPNANAGPDLYFFKGNLVAFDGSLSTDNAGFIANYTWSFTYNGQPVSLSGVSPSFVFDIVGNYLVTLTVADPLGNTATDILWVNITISADSDNDGLLDAWELTYFDDLTYGPSDDPDNDGWNNSKERDEGTDPSKADTDGDGMNDNVDPNPRIPDISEESFMDKYWWILAVIAVAIVVLVLLILLYIRRGAGEEDLEEGEYEEAEADDTEESAEGEEEEGLYEDEELDEEGLEEEELEDESSEDEEWSEDDEGPDEDSSLEEEGSEEEEGLENYSSLEDLEEYEGDGLNPEDDELEK